MKHETKENTHFWLIWSLIFVGLAVCLVSLFLPPVGIVSDSVLWLMGQIFIFAGAMFGVDYRIDGKIKQLISKEKKDENK